MKGHLLINNPILSPVLLSIAVLAFPLNGGGDPVSTATTAIAVDKTVGDILNQLDDHVATWESNAGVIANNTALNVAGQISADAQRLRAELSHDLSENINQLSSQERAALLQLVDAAEDFEKKVDEDALNIKDETVVDIRRILYNIHILGGGGFFIQTVTGTVIRQNNLVDTIDVNGVGFGFSSPELASTSSLQLQINTNGPTVIDGLAIHANITRYSISETNFSTAWAKNASRTLTADLIVDLVEKKSFLLFWTKTKTSHYDVPISITLLPQVGGNFTLSYTAPVFGWKPEPALNQSQTLTTPNGNSKHGHHFWTPFNLAVPTAPHAPPRLNDQSFYDAKITKVIEMNPGCSAFSHQTITFEPGGPTASLSLENWGWPFTATFTGFVQQYEHIGDVSTNLAQEEFPLDGEVDVPLPIGFLHARLAINSYDGHVSAIDVNRATDHTDVVPIPDVPLNCPLRYVDSYQTANSVVYTFSSVQ